MEKGQSQGCLEYATKLKDFFLKIASDSYLDFLFFLLSSSFWKDSAERVFCHLEILLCMCLVISYSL